MIIFVILALGLISYNTVVDNPSTKTTQEVYNEMKEVRTDNASSKN